MNWQDFLGILICIFIVIMLVKIDANLVEANSEVLSITPVLECPQPPNPYELVYSDALNQQHLKEILKEENK